LAFFDFLTTLEHYEERARSADRMNRRHQFLVNDFADDIAGARVLDLGAHDGRWSYAFAAAGAASVVGIEARALSAARLTEFPDSTLRAKVLMRVDDVYSGLEKAIAAGERFDVVAVYGLLYHLMDHFRLFTLIKALKPTLVIVDSEFNKRPGAIITLTTERTDNPLNAAAQFAGQTNAVKGIPSKSALELMAKALDYGVQWSDWDRLAPDDRSGVRDYYPQEDRKLLRATCALRPIT
jgi:2-polyprenyl-3-methyl-5-hydroxy-6-metoxy-1,4-benzoquinol methylase